MTKEFSPEERLLNLIKRKKEPRPERFEAAGPLGLPKKAANAPMPDTGEIKARLLEPSRYLRLENIKIINMILFYALILLIVYLIVDFVLTSRKELPLLSQEAQIEKVMAAPAEDGEAKPYSYYAGGLAGKKVFKPIQFDKDNRSLKQELPIEDLMGELSLLGIVSGDNPQAIIEDKKQKKSFFLKEGQSAGGVSLKKISDAGVTVIYKGKEFDLAL